MKPHKLLLLALACTWATGAFAQWQWLDKDGRKVFSDLAPPPDTPQSRILKQPGGQARTKASENASSTPLPLPAGASLSTAPAANAAADKTGAAVKVPAEGIDKELQQRKAQIEAKAEAEQAARKKTEDTQNAARRADNCSRAQSAKNTYESGRPLRHTNAQGELVWMDEAARAAEMRHIQTTIASDCKPRP